jgi:hypothetical protein
LSIAAIIHTMELVSAPQVYQMREVNFFVLAQIDKAQDAT